ncbi:MAG: HAD-IA family hydrolase [Rhizomicrobium sp.]
MQRYIALPLTPALIFDLDGTLVDTAPDLLGALNAVLVQEGRRTMDLADLRQLVGHGARAMLLEAMRRTGEPVPAERQPALIDAFIAHYREHLADQSRPFPGVRETLERFSHDCFRMGVLTNKPQELAEPLLENLDLTRYFGAIHGAGRFSYTKPDARVFHHVVDELGGSGSCSIMIGDSATDVATARAAGTRVILLSYGYTPEPVQTLGADVVADSFEELPSIVAGMSEGR